MSQSALPGLPYLTSAFGGSLPASGSTSSGSGSRRSFDGDGPRVEKWARLRKGQVCPHCRSDKGRCQVHPDGLKGYCRRGGGYYDLDQSQPKPLLAPLSATVQLKPVADEVRDVVYRKLLDLCPINERHKADLARRGLSSVLCGSLPDTHEARAAALKAAREAHPEGHEVALPFVASSGEMLIPVKQRGLVVGLRRRLDEPGDGARYRSCAGSTARVHVVLGTWDECSHAFVTEGELKAERVARQGDGQIALGLPGVGNCHEEAIRLALDGDVDGIVIAFDADKRTNANVQAAERKLTERALDAGLDVVIASWPESAGKGIDDVLQAGRGDEVTRSWSGQATPEAKARRAAAKAASETPADNTPRPPETTPAAVLAIVGELVDALRGLAPWTEGREPALALSGTLYHAGLAAALAESVLEAVAGPDARGMFATTLAKVTSGQPVKAARALSEIVGPAWHGVAQTLDSVVDRLRDLGYASDRARADVEAAAERARRRASSAALAAFVDSLPEERRSDPAIRHLARVATCGQITLTRQCEDVACGWETLGLAVCESPTCVDCGPRRARYQGRLAAQLALKQAEDAQLADARVWVLEIQLADRSRAAAMAAYRLFQRWTSKGRDLRWVIGPGRLLVAWRGDQGTGDHARALPLPQGARSSVKLLDAGGYGRAVTRTLLARADHLAALAPDAMIAGDWFPTRGGLVTGSQGPSALPWPSKEAVRALAKITTGSTDPCACPRCEGPLLHGAIDTATGRRLAAGSRFPIRHASIAMAALATRRLDLAATP